LIIEMLDRRAFWRVWSASILLFCFSDAHAETTSPHDGSTAIDRLAGTLTPALAAVLAPLPPLPTTSQEDKLAWVAELARRADAHHGYSATPAWRAIMNWPEPTDGLSDSGATPAPDRSLDRYPVPRGRNDPSLDFAASVALAWLDARRFSCDFPLRARFLVDHGLVRGPLPLEAGRCGAFERWADLERVEAIELIYVTPSWSDPSASMGHVIFRIRHSSEPRITGHSFEPVFAYAAIDNPETTPFYILQGLTGLLTASMTFETMGDAYKRYGEKEGRDLIIYELDLTPRERRFFLAEVYTQRMKKMAIPYAFLTTNCATLAHDLVRAVLPELPRRSSFLMHPHEVVSALLEAGRAHPKALLPSAITRARAAERTVERLSPVTSGTAAPESATDSSALTDLVDAKLDLEAWVMGQRRAQNPGSPSSAELDELLDRRAALPLRAESRFLPAPVVPIAKSGSRVASIGTGVDSEQRARLSLGFAIMDEPIGAPRQALLNRAGRMRLLASELSFSADPSGARLHALNLVVLSTLGLGDRPRTGLGWWASRSGFNFHFEAMSRPAESLDFGLVVRGGPALTLVTSADFSDHLVLSLLVEASTFNHRDAAHESRAAIGLEIEAGLRLDASTGHTLRLAARSLPGWSLPHGFAWSIDGDARLELVMSRDAGLLLIPSFRWHWNGPLGNNWEATLGLAW
jgi:hypothetical protein